MGKCLNNTDIEIETASPETCPIEIVDRCISNTLVDPEIGINGLMNLKEVNAALIVEIKALKKRIGKLEKLK